MGSRFLRLTKFGVIVVFALLVGCASTTVKSYVHPNADFLFVKRIALLPFKDLSNGRDVDKKVREIFLSELLKQGYFDVVEAGEMHRLLSELKIAEPHNMGSAELKELGEKLGVQAVVYGVIEEYRQSVSTGGGAFPEVALSIRMVDAESNIVMWMASSARGGSANVSFMGIGETPYISELTQRISEGIVRSIRKYFEN